MTASADDSDTPLICPACASDGIVLAYCAPVYLFAKSGRVARVVVADEEINYRGRTWCRSCGEIVDTAEEPELGTWPAWEVGW